MAKLDAKAADRLDRDEFAYIDSEGGEHLPINDAAHIRNAVARWSQTEFESEAKKKEARTKILAAAKRHGIEIDPDDRIVRGRHDKG